MTDEAIREQPPRRRFGVGAHALWNPIASETLNRCRPVTDKRKSAWQKLAIRCKESRLKSVCREVYCVALAA